ncbi:glycosyltransferase [Campylobacter sp. MOP7]|uniref:glycosyltransferase family protein n=1 Tax=Campylobacter canis TaxID=3378588 RepID=UPI00387E4B00
MSLKIIHCAIFNEYDNGNFFYGMERKISHGLIQNGHFVYDFSYRDWERSLRFCNIKNSGLKKMNEKLIEICINIKPDLLLMGKAEKITTNTIEKIKKKLPGLKVAQWYVDHLQEIPQFFENLKEIEVFFYPNAINLEELSKIYHNTKFAFIPNISDSTLDKKYDLRKETDIIYIARDYKEDIRYKFATLLDKFCKENNIKCKIYASLGNKPVFGDDFFQEIAKAKIAINFNRDDKLEADHSNKFLGASDRMAQFMGAGICTFSPRINGFERFFEDGKEIVYFDNPNDCFNKIKDYLTNDKFIEIAQRGRGKALEIANAKRVSKFMIETIYNKSFSENYEWKDIIYKNGETV